MQQKVKLSQTQPWNINGELVPLRYAEVDALSLTALVTWNEHVQTWTSHAANPAVTDLVVRLTQGGAEALHIFQQ